MPGMITKRNIEDNHLEPDECLEQHQLAPSSREVYSASSFTTLILKGFVEKNKKNYSILLTFYY